MDEPVQTIQEVLIPKEVSKPTSAKIIGWIWLTLSIIILIYTASQYNLFARFISTNDPDQLVLWVIIPIGAILVLSTLHLFIFFSFLLYKPMLLKIGVFLNIIIFLLFLWLLSISLNTFLNPPTYTSSAYGLGFPNPQSIQKGALQQITIYAPLTAFYLVSIVVIWRGLKNK